MSVTRNDIAYMDKAEFAAFLAQTSTTNGRVAREFASARADLAKANDDPRTLQRAKQHAMTALALAEVHDPTLQQKYATLFGQKYNPNHDQLGRFATGSANATLARQGRESGFSISPFTGHIPKTGWMVSTVEDEQVYDHKLSADEVGAYVKAHLAELRQPNHYLGGWPSGGKIYLDVSQNVPTWEEANRLGIARNQWGVYNNEEKDPNKRFVEVESERVRNARGAKAFKPNADGTHPEIIWLDPNDPQGIADILNRALDESMANDDANKAENEKESE